MSTVIHIGPNPCPLNEVTNIDKAWHSAVGSVLSQLRHVDMTGPGFEMGFCRCIPATMLPSLAALGWGSSRTSHGCAPLYESYWMCEIPQSAPMAHSSVRPLNDSETRIFNRSCRRNNKIDALQLEMSTQSTTSFGNTHLACLSAVATWLKCISCSGV